jgi:hypothetical protein
MIMCDYSVLSPQQRQNLLQKYHRLLKSGGFLLLDVYSLSAFEKREETASYEVNLLDGFWSPHRYYGFQNTFKYENEKVVLDKYTIIEKERTRVVYNWFQYFSMASLKQEFAANNFRITQHFSDVAGAPYESHSPEIAVIAEKA